MGYPEILILEPIKGESDAVNVDPPAWLLQAARERRLPRCASWFGTPPPACAPALQTLRRAGWSGTPARRAPLPPGWNVPLLLLHDEAPTAALSASLTRAAQQAGRRASGGVNVLMADGSVRSLLMGMLLPAVQKISAPAARDPRAARYPLHFHAARPPPPGAGTGHIGQTRPGTVVLQF